MDATYTLYETKARLSEVIRAVEKGTTVVVTVRGRKVARIVPYVDESIDARFARLLASGRLTPPRRNAEKAPLPPPRGRHGALRRFLADRD